MLFKMKKLGKEYMIAGLQDQQYSYIFEKGFPT